MPTDEFDDVDISAMLNQAEPPKSPKHLDAAILKYAREQATVGASGHDDGASWLSLTWLQQNWVSAVATLSVAAIAVSVSLQIFTEPDLQGAAKAGLAEFSLDEAVPTRQASPASLAVEAEAQRPSSAALQDAGPRAQASSAITAQAVLERREFADSNLSQGATNTQSTDATASAAQAQLSANDLNSTAVEAIEELVEADVGQAALALGAGIGDDRVEEDLASSTSARSGVRRSSAATQALAPGLADSLSADAGLQETVITALRSSLATGDQTAVAAQQEFSLQVVPLLEAYRQLTDTAVLMRVQSRYDLARSERPDPRLPETIEALISLLEALEN